MRRAIVCIGLVGLVVASVAPPAFADNAPWSGRRAATLPRGRFEVGVFSPLRYGLTDRLELSAHPLAFFVAPNARIKIGINDSATWHIATRHTLSYPTPLLKLISREGSGGVLPNTAKVPQIIALDNTVMATAKAPYQRRWFTAELGFTVAPRFGESDFPTIELPIVYTRTAAYHTLATGHASFAFEGVIVDPFYYLVQTRGYFVPGVAGGFAAEQTILASWRPGTRFMLELGGVGVWGAYPFGYQVNVLPMIDARFAF